MLLRCRAASRGFPVTTGTSPWIFSIPLIVGQSSDRSRISRTCSIWPSRNARIPPRRCRRTPTCSLTSSGPSRPRHLRSSMFISRRAPGGMEITSVRTRNSTREDDPRHMPPNFYYDQQDFLEEFQTGKRWTWSVGRPHAVCGFSTGGPMNLTLAIAVYCQRLQGIGAAAQLSGQARGLYRTLPMHGRRSSGQGRRVDGDRSEMRQPGVQHHQQRSHQVAEFVAQVRQLLRNGAGSATTCRPCAVLADKGPIWEKIVEKNGLQKFRFEEIAVWGYPDGVFASDYDIVSDTSKARRFDPRSGGHRGDVSSDVLGFSAGADHSVTLRECAQRAPDPPHHLGGDQVMAGRPGPGRSAFRRYFPQHSRLLTGEHL